MHNNGGSGESPSIQLPRNPSLKKAERPPKLKKFKATSLDDQPSTPHFPGPLFPAVRGVTGLPPSSNRHVSIDTDASTKHTSRSNVSTSLGNADANSLSNRDWFYPSFLGPQAARNRVVTVKAASKSPSQGSGERLVGDVQGKVVDGLPQTYTPTKKEEVKIMASQVSTTTMTHLSSVSSPSMRMIRRIKWKSYLFFSLIIFSCIYPVSYVIHLRNKVARLEKENINLRTWCSEINVVGNNDNEVLQPDEYSAFNFFGNADSRTVALYTVVFTLVMPFMLYKYLDYLPQIKNISKRTQPNKEEVPLKKRIAYMVDVCFSVYPYAKLLALLFATMFLIGFGGLALYAVSDASLAEALWLSWSFVADSGNHTDCVGIGPRIVSVSISAGGMLIFAMMLGLVSDSISEKVDSLRKGKSEVIEKNHILILGWSEKLGSLLKQLAIANKSLGGGVVGVLAERDKEEMEMDIAKLEFDFMGTSFICRSGSPLILADLKKVSVSKARAIIVLATDENADQSDARALRVVLSLTGVKEGLRGHVVVEMSDLDNEPLVKLVGGDLIETVVAHDVIGRLMIQCALQPGLAQIWEDILGFENNEFYIKRWPQLDGMRFKDVLLSFPDAIPCGVKVAADNGKIILNPDDNYGLKEGDEVLVIAEDDDTYAPGPLPELHRFVFPKLPEPPKFPEKILFCGWRRDIDDMIMVLEAFLAPGSELWMFNEVPEKERERKLIDGGLDISGLENIKLVHREGNAVIRRHLESLPLETFDSILILADESLEDFVVHSDSRSLASLLLIRDIQSKRLPHKDTKSTSLRPAGFSHSSWIREMQQASDKSIIISEILDSRTRNLVSVSRISDYVLSNELVSMALAMVAEDKQINRVLEELFAEEGNEMCIKPAEFYLFDQEELSFYDVVIRGRERQEIVIGYRLANSERAIINPPKKSEPRKWSLDDVFVVISSGS
ncbi:CASTOR/POLLUX/SYM8 ion channel [Corchorus capsularis]|uniref:CASTOR/POLLUX/SYM8 ion channel n=1 Tax=Corchorus capsularis TaxID=210143 RepID=A0A1R3HY19_COCAP|nr:CASTOR/POLLUX/SYM8 ion channel [Corchorus capsularis]